MMYYLQGLTLGLAYLAPIGMQNLFVINSALTQKQHRAMLTALIVMFFDVTLALTCFFGIGLLMEWYPLLRNAVLFVGGLLVLYIGYTLFRVKPAAGLQRDVHMSLAKTASMACVVTWFNPQAIIDGTMMLGAFQATLPEYGTTHFLLGMTSASGLWFFGLTFFVSLFSHKFTPQMLGVINKICGVIVVAYGLKLLAGFAALL